MGTMQALEMGHLAELEVALRWHLQSNHFPPLPLDLLPVAKQAIDIGNEAISMDDEELWNTMIYVPTADKELPVWRIIEGIHLDSFLDAVQEEVYDDEYHPLE